MYRAKLPLWAVCDDGDPCTVGELCSNGECSAGTSVCACDVTNTLVLKVEATMDFAWKPSHFPPVADLAGIVDNSVEG